MQYPPRVLLALLFLCFLVARFLNLPTSAQEVGGETLVDTEPIVSNTQTIDLHASSSSQSEGHSHRPPLLSPEEDRAYSELNHHVAGGFVLLAGGLAFLAQFRPAQFARAQACWPVVFVLLGVFLFLRHDPESWPLGPLSLQESVSDVQVLQHFIFTVIVLLIGVIEWLRHQQKLTHALWSLLFPALAVSAALMLFAHHHGEGPSAEKVYQHHAMMAVTGIAAMVAKVLDEAQFFKGKIGSYLWSGLIIFVGLLLVFYTE